MAADRLNQVRKQSCFGEGKSLYLLQLEEKKSEKVLGNPKNQG